MKLLATVIEVAPQDGYGIVRFQLSSDNVDYTTGDCFSVVVTDFSAYTEGQIFEMPLQSI